MIPLHHTSLLPKVSISRVGSQTATWQPVTRKCVIVAQAVPNRRASNSAGSSSSSSAPVPSGRNSSPSSKRSSVDASSKPLKPMQPEKKEANAGSKSANDLDSVLVRVFGSQGASTSGKPNTMQKAKKAQPKQKQSGGGSSKASTSGSKAAAPAAPKEEDLSWDLEDLDLDEIESDKLFMELEKELIVDSDSDDDDDDDDMAVVSTTHKKGSSSTSTSSSGGFKGFGQPRAAGAPIPTMVSIVSSTIATSDMPACSEGCLPQAIRWMCSKQYAICTHTTHIHIQCIPLQTYIARGIGISCTLWRMVATT